MALDKLREDTTILADVGAGSERLAHAAESLWLRAKEK
jgi:hypothetical protein